MSSTKTKCNKKEFQNQIDELTKKNEELRAKCLSYESEILTLRADGKSKQEFMDKVDDLSHRICRIIEQKKNDQSKHIECQQLDRNFFDTKIRELTADLQVAHDSINDLKSIIHQQDQTNKQDIIRYQNEIERLKSDERNALSAAGNYFKTYFPSIKSLQDHCESNPIVTKYHPKANPFTPADADLLHQSDVKKMKKQIGTINKLKDKNSDLQQTLELSESVNKSLEKDKEVLKREIAQIRMAQVKAAELAEQKEAKVIEESEALKTELETAKRKINELELLIQRNTVKTVEKDANHRNEITLLQQKIENETEKSEKIIELEEKLKKRQSLIDQQKVDLQGVQSKLNHLADIQSEQIVQIAHLQAVNQKKSDKIKNLKSKVKAMREIPTKVEVPAQLTWDQLSSPEIPSELQKSLCEIVETSLIPIENKVKNVLKTACSYYTAHQQNLEEFYNKHRNKYVKTQKSFASFISEIGNITLNRVVEFNEAYESQELQNDIIAAVNKYLAQIKELESNIRKVRASFPYDQLTSLKENLKSQSDKLNDLKLKNKELRKEMKRRQISLSFASHEVFCCENDGSVLHNTIKQQKERINEIEQEIKMANELKVSSERKLDEERKSNSDTKSKLCKCQREIEKMKRIHNEKEEIISELNAKIRSTAIDELTQKVRKADDDRAFLMNEISSLRDENANKAEYEHTIHHLQVKVNLLEQELDKYQNAKANEVQLNARLMQIEQERNSAHNEIHNLRNEKDIIANQAANSAERKQVEIINSLKAKLENSENNVATLQQKLQEAQDMIPISEQACIESNEKILELNNQIKELQAQMEKERQNYLQQIKDAKLNSIKEYKILVEQLNERCTKQKATIAKLTNQLKSQA